MLNESMKKKYFEMKIYNYQNQDEISHKVIIKNEYINYEWFEEIMKKEKNCSSCMNKYYLYIKDGEIMSNVSVNRINNNMAHHLNNCELLCINCNCAKSDKNNIIIQSDKNMKIKIKIQEIVKEKKKNCK